LAPEGATFLDRHPPQFSTAVYRTESIYLKPACFRVSWLWLPLEDRVDYWWSLVLDPDKYNLRRGYNLDAIKDCRPLVSTAVLEAKGKLKLYLIPAFDKIIQQHGVL
jgi:hypothetical protein